MENLYACGLQILFIRESAGFAGLVLDAALKFDAVTLPAR